jgi:hypothetical protein
VLVLIRMIFSLAVAMTLLLSSIAIASPTTGPAEKAALLAFAAVMLGTATVVWRLTRPGATAH